MLRRLIPSCSTVCERDCLTLCRALGYDLNTVEFACEDGIPYAIDFMNPAPDADVNSVGQANFDWIVNAVAELAVSKARQHTGKVTDYRWSQFLSGYLAEAAGAAKETCPGVLRCIQASKQAGRQGVNHHGAAKPQHRDRRGIPDD